MLKKFKFIALLGFAITILLNSCSDTTTNPIVDPQPKPQPISNMMATSVDSKTVKMKFDLSPSETNTLFKDYQLVVTPGTFAPLSIPKGNNMVQLTNLTEGTVYKFEIVARYTNDSISTVTSIEWSPATRFLLNNNDEVIRVYETASDFGSGLRMFATSPDNSPRTYKVSNGAEWDLGIDTRNSKLIFGSATKIDYSYTSTPKPTQMLDVYFEADSLNGLFDSQAMNAGTRDSKYAEKTFDLTTLNPTKHIIFYVRKYEPGQTRYNYAKVLLKKNPAGAGFIQGTTPNRYLEFQISYQMTPDVPYAKVANNNESK